MDVFFSFQKYGGVFFGFADDEDRGRSTGYGALIINTHGFKDVAFIKKYTGPGDWSGGAAVVGAGVQGRELYRKCFAQHPKVVIVGGECPVCYFLGFLLSVY